MKAFLYLLVLFICGFALLLVIAPILSGSTERTYTRAAVYEYQRLRLKAEQGDLSQAASALKETLAFWPSKISHESMTAGVVAAFRDSTVREILTRMRSLSGEDLGADPEPWLNKYHKPEQSQPNQQGGANRSQPTGTATNQTSPAAGSGRSP